MNFERFYDMTLDGALRMQATTHADRTFLAHGKRRWSYAEADAQVDALAAGLIELGLRPGARLALLLPNLPEFILTLFAAARAGLFVVPISVRCTKDELTSFLAKTRSQAIVAPSDPATLKGLDHLTMIHNSRSELPELEHVISFGTKHKDVLPWEALVLSNAAALESRSKPADPFAILHTMGSSGEPRGAVLKHSSLVRNAADIAARMKCTPDDVFLGAPPFSNTFGMTPTCLLYTSPSPRD